MLQCVVINWYWITGLICSVYSTSDIKTHHTIVSSSLHLHVVNHTNLTLTDWNKWCIITKTWKNYSTKRKREKCLNFQSKTKFGYEVEIQKQQHIIITVSYQEASGLLAPTESFSALGPFSTCTASNQHLAKGNTEWHECIFHGRKRIWFPKHRTVVWWKRWPSFVTYWLKCVDFTFTGVSVRIKITCSKYDYGFVIPSGSLSL